MFERRERDHRVGALEPQRSARDQSQLTAEMLDARVGQSVLPGRHDPGLVLGDRARKLHERRQPEPAGPVKPAVQQLLGLAARDPVDLAELLLR